MNSKSKSEFLNLIKSLEYKADDIRAQLEDINPHEDLEFKDPDAMDDLELDLVLQDIATAADQLTDQLKELFNTANEVTK